MKPLVSCVMLTKPGRERFMAEALECFESQTWPNREIVVVGDVGTVGEKRNMGASRSRGEIIAHWDDDDWSHPYRLERQVSALLESDAEICGFRCMVFWADDSGDEWLYEGAPDFLLGTSLVYRKDAWRKRPFEPLMVGEDLRFVRGRRILTLDDHWLMRARIHAGNTSRKKVDCREYRKLSGVA